VIVEKMAKPSGTPLLKRQVKNMTYPMLENDLMRLQQCPDFKNDSFGISRIQRVFRIGYNRAAHLVDAAIEKGILTRDSENEWLVKLTKEDNQ
jgi:DNA segregation ATPase FtsK/SpoIIIE-like protein